MGNGLTPLEEELILLLGERGPLVFQTLVFADPTNRRSMSVTSQCLEDLKRRGFVTRRVTTWSLSDSGQDEYEDLTNDAS